MKATFLAGMITLVATPALAHSGLDATAPENGTVLAQAPPHIVLTFAKRIRLTGLGGAGLMEASGNAGCQSAMPGLGDVMSEDEIRDVLAYIRSTWPERIRDIQAGRNPEHGR